MKRANHESNNMSINESQASGSKIGENYGCPAGELELEKGRKDNSIVLDMSDAKADGLTHMKLTHNGHVFVLQASELVTRPANASLDSLNPTPIN